MLEKKIVVDTNRQKEGSKCVESNISRNTIFVLAIYPAKRLLVPRDVMENIKHQSTNGRCK